MYATAEPEFVDPSHLEELTDGDLIRMVKAGDDAALGVLLRRHRDALYRFCLHLTHNRDDAEDVCQESMARAITRVGSLQTGSAFRSWLFSIARNLSIDSHRNRKRICALPDEDLAPLPLPLHHESPYDRVETHEEYQTVAEALSRLKKNHQTVLVLREIQGLSYADIAARLDLSQAAVETLLFRARKRLREEYTKTGRPVPVVAALGALRNLLSRLSLPFGGAPLAAKLAATALLVGGAVVATPRLVPAMHVFGAGAPAVTAATQSVTRAISLPATSGSMNNGAAVGRRHATSAAGTVQRSSSRSVGHHSGRAAGAGAAPGSSSHGSTSTSQPRFHRISGHHLGGSASTAAGKPGSAGTKNSGSASAASGARSSSGTATHTQSGSTSRQGGASGSNPSATTVSRAGGTSGGKTSPAAPSGSSASGSGQPGGTSSGSGTNPPPSSGSNSGSSGPAGSTVSSAQQTVNNTAAGAQQTVTSTTNSAQQTVNNTTSTAQKTVNNTTSTAQQTANNAANSAQQTVNNTTSTAQKTASNAVATATNTVSKTVSKVTGTPAPPKAPVKTPVPLPTPTVPVPKLP